MPCTICNALFHTRPCEHPSGILEYYDKLIKITNFSSYILAVYKDLHDICPCKECLVKIVCNPGIKHCVEYNSLIEKVKIYF